MASLTYRQSGTRIDIRQKVGSQTGGQIIGVYNAASEAKAPEPKIIIDYLEGIIDKTGPRKDEKNEMLNGLWKRLWEVPFYVHPLGRKHIRQRLDNLIYTHFDPSYSGNLLCPAISILADPGVGKTPALYYLLAKVAERSLSLVIEFSEPSFKGLRDKISEDILEMLTPLENKKFIGVKNFLDAIEEQVGEKHSDRCKTLILEHVLSSNQKVAFETNEYLPFIPLFIPLAQLRPGQDFLSLVRAAFNRYSWDNITENETHMLLKKYDCLLLLDDLDKVAFGQYRRGIQVVQQFLDTYPQEHYVITCRTSGYHDQFGPLDTFMLARLTQAEIQDVLGEHYDEKMSRSLQQLAGNRAMLEIIIRGQDTREMIWSRGRIAQRMVHIQLGLEEQENAATEVDLEMIERLLEHLAYRMYSERTYRYSEKQLMEFIIAYLDEWHEPYTWRQIIKVLRQTGIMRREERRQWRFNNRTTHAYFVAAMIIQEPALIQTLLDNVSDFWWHEALEMLIGLIDDPSGLLFELIDRDPLLTAYCLQFVGQPIDNQTIINAIIDALIERMRHERAFGRERLVKLLIEIGYSPSEDVLWHLLYQEQKSLVILALARALVEHPNLNEAKIRRKRITEGKEQKIDNIRKLKEIIEWWQEYAKIESDDEQKVKDSEQKAKDDERKAQIEEKLISRMGQSQKTQEAILESSLAAIALGFLGEDNARKALLKQFKKSRQDTFMAWCVVEALTQIRHPEVERAAIELYNRSKRRKARVQKTVQTDQEQTQKQVKKCAQKQAQEQCIRAIYLLGAVGRGTEATRDILYKALNDSDADIKGYAARSIGRLGLIGAREKLEEQLKRLENRRKESPWILRRIVEALGEVGNLDSLAVLEPYLRHEQHRTRNRVREAIAKIQQRYEVM